MLFVREKRKGRKNAKSFSPHFSTGSLKQAQE